MASDPYSAMIGLGTQMIGNIGGNMASEHDRDAAKAAQLAALESYTGLNPTLQQVDFQNYENAGNFSPQLVQALQQQQSELKNIQADPQYKSAQMGALESLQGIGKSGGLTIQDQANLNSILGQTGSQEAGKRAAITQDFAQRGKGGSGFELAQQLLNAQSSANNANQQGTTIAGQAQQRALQALMAGGQMAGQFGAQDFSQKAQVGGAQDIINRFNTQNSQSVANANAAAQNQGQMYNLQNQQSIANNNTGLQNQQQLQNNQYKQQLFQNQLSKANGVSGQQNNVANMYNNNANATQQQWSQAGQGAGQVASSFAAPKQQQNAGVEGGGMNGAMAGYTAAIQNQPKKNKLDDEGIY